LVKPSPSNGSEVSTTASPRQSSKAGTSHLRPVSRSRSPGLSASSRASSAHPVTPRGDDHPPNHPSRGSPRPSHLTPPGCVHVDADMV
jgi:hypothetical protein